jgi:hypothetical protein
LAPFGILPPLTCFSQHPPPPHSTARLLIPFQTLEFFFFTFICLTTLAHYVLRFHSAYFPCFPLFTFIFSRFPWPGSPCPPSTFGSFSSSWTLIPTFCYSLSYCNLFPLYLVFCLHLVCFLFFHFCLPLHPLLLVYCFICILCFLLLFLTLT